MQLNSVLITPVLTEKGVNLARVNQYMFEVNEDANKNQVKTAIESLYGVEVDTIRIMVRKGKERRVGRKMMTKKLPDKKIAVIILKKGTIDLFPQT